MPNTLRDALLTPQKISKLKSLIGKKSKVVTKNDINRLEQILGFVCNFKHYDYKQSQLTGIL